MTKIKTGEVWKATSRGFIGSFKVLSNIDTTEDSFFTAEIITGEVVYLNRPTAKAGIVVSFRTNLTDFLEQIEWTTKK